MKHTYKIYGMTCGNCLSSVEKQLGSLTEVSRVDVDLERSEATIFMNEPLELTVLNNALSDRYSISEIQEEAAVIASKSSTKTSKWQQLKPLFLIFFYIAAAALLLNFREWDGRAAMLDFMGLFFIVFSFFKVLDFKGFPESFRMYDPLAKVFPAYGWVYPFIEIALGLMFLMRFQLTIALGITILVLGITTVGVSQSLLNKKSIRCACLGTVLDLPMTEATFIENSIMLIMAFGMLFTGVA